MQPEKLWILIARKLAQEASDSNLMELNNEMIRDPDIAYMVELLGDFWDHIILAEKNANNVSLKRAWQRVRGDAGAAKQDIAQRLWEYE